jgi:Spt4/RpoE2 zinc finger
MCVCVCVYVCMYVCMYVSRLIAMTQPDASWVAQWEILENKRPGVYAVAVVGAEDDNDEY